MSLERPKRKCTVQGKGCVVYTKRILGIIDYSTGQSVRKEEHICGVCSPPLIGKYRLNLRKKVS